jgi:hypothetical protein
MAFTTYTLISDVIENFTGKNLSSGSADALRSKILAEAQRIGDKIWYHYQWPFRTKSGTVSLTSGVGDLPSDFHNIGPHGFVYRAAYDPLEWRPLQKVLMLQTEVAQSANSAIYAIGDTYNSGGTRKRRIYCYPLETTTIYIQYERSSPVLVDQSSPSTDGMLEWPTAFYNVIYEGVIWKRMRSVGNTQYQDQKGIFLEALADQVKAERQGRETSHYLAPFPGRNI